MLKEKGVAWVLSIKDKVHVVRLRLFLRLPVCSEINDLHQIRVMFPSTWFQFKQKLQLLPFICHPVFAGLSTVVFFFFIVTAKLRRLNPKISSQCIVYIHACWLISITSRNDVFRCSPEKMKPEKLGQMILYLSPGRETSLSGVDSICLFRNVHIFIYRSKSSHLSFLYSSTV